METNNKIGKGTNRDGTIYTYLTILGERELVEASHKAINDPNLKLASKGEYPITDFNVGEDVYELKVVAELKEKVE